MSFLVCLLEKNCNLYLLCSNSPWDFLYVFYPSDQRQRECPHRKKTVYVTVTTKNRKEKKTHMINFIRNMWKTKARLSKKQKIEKNKTKRTQTWFKIKKKKNGKPEPIESLETCFGKSSQNQHGLVYLCSQTDLLHLMKGVNDISSSPWLQSRDGYGFDIRN